MTLTHAQLLDAVRAVGRDRESFTCADVRQHLGLSTGDRKQLNRFYSRFRALQKGAASELEKLGSNCYRLRAAAAEPAAVEQGPKTAPVQCGEPIVLTFEDEVEVVTAECEPLSTAPAVSESGAGPAVAPVPSSEPGDADLGVQAPGEAVPMSTAESRADGGAAPEQLPTAPVAAVSKPRNQWLSRMASFFSRRGNKRDVSSGAAALS